MAIQLIADAGSTKTSWVLHDGNKSKKFTSEGISPYFLSVPQIVALLTKQVKSRLKGQVPDAIHYYGTGCSAPEKAKEVKKALKEALQSLDIAVHHDLFGAARGLCGREKGIACILGTGSNSCYYNGKKIVNNSPGLGFVLGDEGSGAYLGKKVVQYFLYNTFDPDLMDRFHAAFHTNKEEILNSVYRMPLPNRYLAQFTGFLADNRGHYMVENIIEDGLNDFFFTHICKYKESWTLPIHFTGSVAFGFKDVIKELCNTYELTLGKIIKNPIEGLIDYHING
jgi:N-acetylglucosamine kinase-like BadF-type ATPase